MMQTIRNVLQVLVLSALGVGAWMGISFLEPELPLCSPDEPPWWLPQWLGEPLARYGSDERAYCNTGEIVIVITLIGMVLFVGRWRMLWSLAPPVVAVIGLLWSIAGNNLARTTLDDGTRAFNWPGLGVLAAVAAALVAVAGTTYGVVALATRGIRWLAISQAPAIVAARARGRRAARIATLVVLGAAMVYWLASRTDAYQFFEMRREATRLLREHPDVWAPLAVETGVPLAVVDALDLSPTTLLNVAAIQDTAAAAASRRKAIALAGEKCSRSPSDCSSVIHALEQGGFRDEARALEGARPAERCDSYYARETDPLERAALVLRQCRAEKQPPAAQYWAEALAAASGARGDPGRAWDNVLAVIPESASVPPASLVFKGVQPRDLWKRSDRAGALFRGLVAGRRWDEAADWFAGLDPAIRNDVSDFLPSYSDGLPPVDFLTRLGGIVTRQFEGSSNTFSRDQWLARLAAGVARGGDPDAALALLPSNDRPAFDALDAIVEAFQRAGQPARGLEVLAQLPPTDEQARALRARVCIELAPRGASGDCVSNVAALNPRDAAAVLALSGAVLVKSGRTREGGRLLDRAEALVDLDEGSRIDPVIAGALAEAGRVRAARVQAATLSEGPRAACYQAISRHIRGSRRTIGVALSSLADTWWPLP